MPAITVKYHGPSNVMTQTYDKLSACSLTPEQRAMTCNYWYVVQDNHGPHTAFTTRRGLDNWLAERNLKLENDLPRQAEYGYTRIIGAYRAQIHSSYDEFFGLPAVAEVRELSNGDYTLGIVTREDDGIITIHTLNPNCRHRPVFNYHESREMMK